MRAVKSRVMKGAGARVFPTAVAFMAAAAGLAAMMTGGGALAQNGAECARLQQEIAASRHGPNGQIQAAAERQRGELARTTAYARSLGCENRKFLIFGSDPPAQCGELNGQISRMQANLNDLQARGGGGSGDLVARYNSECVQRQPGNFFEALFNGFRPPNANQEPIEPETPAARENSEGQSGEGGVNAHAGGYAVCVRSCDGSFFPVSYSGAGSRSDSLEEVCRALCPNAEVELYSFGFGGTINTAVSASGEPYVNSPNALKYLQSYDPTCSCRRKGQSWADALAGAEARYGHEAKDILVTAEKSAEMARPIDPKTKVDPKAKMTKASAKSTVVTQDLPAPGLDANGADTKLSAEAATISREGSGIAGGDRQGGARYGEGQGQTVEVTGPDGVKKRVRVVGPTL